ncbi:MULTISPECIES: Gfo/Idh/MocA family protein [unclassified Novosphingobium]|uniref:Gfo/Idh/MocA family protein n=1 Tax=unclassified Novosphingobium TaxID=2644732 RepID=UPI00086A8139|nr:MULTISPECIES: Gfo/Idh/MocA family oxidoreductase [unclassified Novosphingobium]MDR6707184.1 putative dehydrogenase [Novosphingobium sp. 1748]ODU82856.1 MAG: galactose 1-dehydrogenase [Novosphingobium sp. SCN 63-17]OJX96560.1 MAG: galactose 1-dehydrogenase [Novosphingobium sp. 63-713]
MSNSLIRLGLVGLGKIARDQHLPAIAENPRFALTATADPQGALEGIASYPTLDALLDARLALDAVVLCTPPSVRAGLAQRALEAGLHVMLEKPPAAGLSQVDALVRASAGCTMLATWHSRESAAVDAAAAWLAARQIKAVRLNWREDVRVWHPGQDWLLAAGGFGVFDTAINAFSILTHILPQPLALESADLGIPANRQAPMTARLTMRHAGAEVACDLSILHPGAPQWDIAVDTDAGLLQLTQGGQQMTIDNNAQEVAPDAEYPRLYARFARLIDAGQSDVDARPLTLVADAMMLGSHHSLPPFEF